jgi:hypothetical protein
VAAEALQMQGEALGMGVVVAPAEGGERAAAWQKAEVVGAGSSSASAAAV